MIRTPPRAVTRFLIPFIDVLILLFCIFLLMPFVSQPGEGETKDDTEKLKLEVSLLKSRVEQLKKERANLFDRFHVRLVDIDGANGRLYVSDMNGRREIASADDARQLILAERSKAGSRDVCVLILYPRQLSGFPLREQIDRYRGWFRDVPHAFDNPWSG